MLPRTRLSVLAKTDFKAADYNQNKNTVSTLRKRNPQVELEEDHINITYGILDQIFKVFNEKDISATQIISCLTTLSKKVKMVLQTLSKNHIIL